MRWLVVVVAVASTGCPEEPSEQEILREGLEAQDEAWKRQLEAEKAKSRQAVQDAKDELRAFEEKQAREGQRR